MSEVVNGKQIFSLSEVTKSIQKTLSDRYKSAYWIKAEMIKLNHYTKSGHCYPDLVEKKDGVLIAQIRAILWKDDFVRTNKRFLEILKEPLKDGIKLLFQANITYDPTHGLALRILDIDPGYTMGDLEKEKQETLQKLRDEGIYGRNKSLKMTMLPQRIAIVSVQTSKGYADFLSVIEKNPWNYRFFHFLFPSILQGDNAVIGIIKQLRRIRMVIDHFDIVAIIRGGGGDIGLSCYNDYQLSKEIALFPLPVITGIGHSTNETVAEMISHTNAITPTKLAEYLIQKFHNFSVPVQKAEETIRDKSRRMINDEKIKFQSEVKLFRSVTANIFQRNQNDIRSIIKSLVQQSQFIFRNERESLQDVKEGIKRGSTLFCICEKQKIGQVIISIDKDVNFQIGRFKMTVNQQANQIVQGSRFFLQNNAINIDQTKIKLAERTTSLIKGKKIEIGSTERNIINMSPHNVLKRGYSITLCNGKAVNSIEQVVEGEVLKTVVFDGNISSIVQSTNKSEEQ